MDATSVTAVLSALAGSTTTVAAIWLRTRGQQMRAREKARRGELRDLPPGTRVVDLGKHGLIIDVGGKDGRTRNAGP